jgi:hypothetical protein
VEGLCETQQALSVFCFLAAVLDKGLFMAGAAKRKRLPTFLGQPFTLSVTSFSTGGDHSR